MPGLETARMGRLEGGAPEHRLCLVHKTPGAQVGPDVPIGAMILEPDLVERWEEPTDTRYIFHLRRGVRFHDKPPVGGRELVAEDVRYAEMWSAPSFPRSVASVPSLAPALSKQEIGDRSGQ